MYASIALAAAFPAPDVYKRQILDISTDISVLESMFQKEGLTDHQEKE